jgi:acetyltransferase-like isoleucine patch superfamily enzyme
MLPAEINKIIMIQPQAAIFRNLLRRMLSAIRKQYLKVLGLQIGDGGDIGIVNCNWPKNVKIGSQGIIQDGVNFHITHPFSETNCIEIGDRVFIGYCCMFNCVTQIRIGNDVMIAANTIIVDVGHAFIRDTTINKQPILGEEIIIGDDVWVGAGCVILKGVSIGNGSIIGAGSVVNKSVPEYQIWAGSPARFLRNRD